MLFSPNGTVTEYAQTLKRDVLFQMPYQTAGTDSNGAFMFITTSNVKSMVGSSDPIGSNAYLEIKVHKYKNSDTNIVIDIKVHNGPQVILYNGSENIEIESAFVKLYCGNVSTGLIGYFLDYSGYGTPQVKTITLNSNSITIGTATSIPTGIRNCTVISELASPSSLDTIKTNIENEVNNSLNDLTETVNTTIDEVNNQMDSVKQSLQNINDEVSGTQAKIKSSYVSR